MFNDALIDNVKGHVNNNVHVFGRKSVSFEVITSLKIVSQQDQILLLLQLGYRDISRLTYSHPSSHLQSLLTHMQTFYSEVKSFTKNGDKFGWVKYWRMTFNSSNTPKFSPARILHYTVWCRTVDNSHKND